MALSLNGSTGISGIDGHSGVPAIKGADADTGIFFGTDTASISTAGSERLIVDASGNINVDSGGVYYDAANSRLGVGTTAPRGLLHVGPDLASGATDAAAINLKQSSTTAATGIYLERSNERRGFSIFMGGDQDSLTFQRNNVGIKSVVLSLYRDGQVGFGGHGSPRSDVLFFENSTNHTPYFQIETVGNNYNGGLSIVNNSSSGYGPAVTIGCSGTATKGGSAAGSRGNGWQNGHIHFASAEGNNMKAGATLSSYLDASIADNKVPSNLIIRTAPRTEDAPVERLRIDSLGRHSRKYPRYHTDTSTGTYGYHAFAYLSERAPGSDGTARFYRLKSTTTMVYGGGSVPPTIRLNVGYNTYHAAGAGSGEYIICSRNGGSDEKIQADLFRKLSEYSSGGWYYGLGTGFSVELYRSTGNGELIIKVIGRTGNGSTYDGSAHIHIACEALGGTFTNNGTLEIIPLGATAPSELSTQVTTQNVTWS